MCKRDEKIDELIAASDMAGRAFGGDAEALYLMRVMYVKQPELSCLTFTGAFRCLQLAAEKGHAKANFRLGELCLKSQLPPELLVDFGRDKADMYFRKAAEGFEAEVEKDAESCLYLSAMYEGGLGVTRNTKIARELLEQSAEMGNEVAIKRLKGKDLDPMRLLRRALFGCVALLMATFSVIAAPTVKTVEANQRYPWNGLVDIVVTIQGSADEMNETRCTFVATNSATLAEVPVKSVAQVGSDSISGDVCTRRFIWYATNDVGTVKIDDLALTVDAVPLGGVQLWENGPFWAECNVGASKPEEYGYYFWWGDTVGYKRNASNNGWVSVKDGSGFSFSSGNCPTYGKDNSTLQSAGYIDSTGNLVAAHDAATAHLGAPWRMPTDAEFSALINNCDTQWTTRGGVYGRLVTGRGAYASKSIFLPAAGYGSGSSLNNTGSDGNYWSSTPYSDSSGDPWYLGFGSSDFTRDYYDRVSGRSVRPLRGFAK